MQSSAATRRSLCTATIYKRSARSERVLIKLMIKGTAAKRNDCLVNESGYVDPLVKDCAISIQYFAFGHAVHIAIALYRSHKNHMFVDRWILFPIWPHYHPTWLHNDRPWPYYRCRRPYYRRRWPSWSRRWPSWRRRWHCQQRPAAPAESGVVVTPGAG